MIYCLEGTPGVGKTLYMVSKIIPDYLKIRTANGDYCPVHIWTNIEGLKPSLLCALAKLPESITMYIHTIGEYIDDDGKKSIDKRYLEYFYYDPQSIEWVQDYDPKNKRTFEHPDYTKAYYLPWNSLIILDELQNIFGSRDFDKQFTRDALPYITRHRHYGHNIFWASQDHEQVEVSFRRNTEQVWKLESLDNFSLFGGDKEFKVSKYEGKFAGYLVNVNPFATEKVKKDERYFKVYKSHVSDEVKEKRHTSNMWTHSKPLKIVAGIFVVLIVLIVINGNPLKKLTMGAQSREQAKHSAQATSPTTQGLVPVAGLALAKESKDEKQKVENEDVVCYISKYILRGRLFYKLNTGKTILTNGGAEYEECK